MKENQKDFKELTTKEFIEELIDNTNGHIKKLSVQWKAMRLHRDKLKEVLKKL